MQENGSNPSRVPLTNAAEYVRMSTEHQQYSTENQSDAIHRYAESRGYRIVRSYSDAGKSGLNLAGRPGLQQLLQDVQTGNMDFTVVLVYDISRWGRFQDADESGYYEYICKRAKVRVHYCAEQFANDDSLPSSLLKTIKRTMAGEYFGGRPATEISPRRSHPAQRARRGGEAEASDPQAIPAGADRRSSPVRRPGTQEGQRRHHHCRLIYSRAAVATRSPSVNRICGGFQQPR